MKLKISQSMRSELNSSITGTYLASLSPRMIAGKTGPGGTAMLAVQH